MDTAHFVPTLIRARTPGMLPTHPFEQNPDVFAMDAHSWSPDLPRSPASPLVEVLTNNAGSVAPCTASGAPKRPPSNPTGFLESDLSILVPTGEKDEKITSPLRHAIDLPISPPLSNETNADHQIDEVCELKGLEPKNFWADMDPEDVKFMRGDLFPAILASDNTVTNMHTVPVMRTITESPDAGSRHCTPPESPTDMSTASPGNPLKKFVFPEAPKPLSLFDAQMQTLSTPPRSTLRDSPAPPCFRTTHGSRGNTPPPPPVITQVSRQSIKSEDDEQFHFAAKSQRDEARKTRTEEVTDDTFDELPTTRKRASSLSQVEDAVPLDVEGNAVGGDTDSTMTLSPLSSFTNTNPFSNLNLHNNLTDANTFSPRPSNRSKSSKKKDVSVLAPDHKPARGRGRTIQLQSMTKDQIKAEADVRAARNRRAAKECRARKKNHYDWLKQKVQELEAKDREAQFIIASLRQHLFQHHGCNHTNILEYGQRH